MADRRNMRGTAVDVRLVDCYEFCPELRPDPADIDIVRAVDIAAFCARLPAMTDQPGAPWATRAPPK
jgi:hypothetical protein